MNSPNLSSLPHGNNVQGHQSASAAAAAAVASSALTPNQLLTSEHLSQSVLGHHHHHHHSFYHPMHSAQSQLPGVYDKLRMFNGGGGQATSNHGWWYPSHNSPVVASGNFESTVLLLIDYFIITMDVVHLTIRADGATRVHIFLFTDSYRGQCDGDYANQVDHPARE